MNRLMARTPVFALSLALGVALASLAPPQGREEPAALQPGQTTTPPLRAEPAVAAKTTTAAARISQTDFVTFPAHGRVRVRAVENYGEPMRLEFLRADTGEVVKTVEVAGDARPGPELAYTNPFLRFKVVRAFQRRGPLVFAVAVTPGGSDRGFHATLVAEVDGEIRELSDSSGLVEGDVALSTDTQGGMFVGDLGRGRGPGVAVWRFMWEDGAHYGPHRYEVELYPFDTETGRLLRGDVLRSRLKHGGQGEGALAELGLPYTNLLGRMPGVAEYHSP